MKTLREILIRWHWIMFFKNALYFLVSLIPTALYIIIRYEWNRANGKYSFGRTPEKEYQEEDDVYTWKDVLESAR